jgi:hypothetical protein
MHEDTAVDDTRPETQEDHGSSRRKLLRGVAAGIAGVGAVSVIGGVGTAHAADGAPLNLGTNNDHASATNVNYTGPVRAVSFNVQSGAGAQTAANDTILNNTFASAGTAFLGVASGDGNQLIGVTGWSKKPGGTGVVGFTGGAGAYGGEFFGGLAEVRLRPDGAAPITLTNAHQAGELYEDATGTLWICVEAGTPGSWREIASTSSAGAFHAITPRRVYDSRTATGKLEPGVDRTISVANSTDGTLDVVPVKSSAVALTVTVTQTSGSGGFVAVRPGGTVYNGTSSINWFGPDQSMATTVISGIDADRQITLRAGVQSTHIAVDVTGYYR